MDLSFFNDLNSGVALAVLGYFGFILKDIPFRIWSLVQQKLSVSIQADNNNLIIYNATNRYCIDKFPELKNHLQAEAEYTDSKFTDQNIACGTYYFLYDWCTVAIVEKTVNTSSVSTQFKYMIYIRGIGLHRANLLKEYKTELQKYLPDMTKNILIDSMANYERYTSIVPKKSFDDVFFNHKQDVINIIENFKKNQELYLKHGITYKTGFLFYGQPGSGKTTLARAIASYLNWEIIVLSKKIGLDDVNNAVILFEDIDCISENREDEEKEDKRKHARVSSRIENWNLQDLLNMIDGVSSPNNCIFIATTNYLDRIDPALRRKGRFDHVFEVNYLDEALAKEMCDRYEVPYSFLDGYTFPVSAADLQAKIMYHKISN